MPTSDVYSIHVNGICPVSGLVENVIQYRLTTAPTHTPFEMAEDLISVWNTACVTRYRAIMGTNCSIESLTAEQVSTPGGPTANFPINLVGTEGDHMADSALAMCIAFLPGAPPFRRKEGRLYTFAVPDDALEDNVWQPTFLINVDLFSQSLLGPFASIAEPANSWKLVIWDRKTKTAADVANITRRLRPSHLRKRQRPYPV